MLPTKLQNKLDRALRDKNFAFVFKGSFHTLFSMGTVFFLRFLSGVIIARFYGPKVSGELTNLITFMSLFGILGNFGLKDAMLKLIPEYKEKYNLATALHIYKRSVMLISAFWLVCMVLMFFVAPWQAEKWKVPQMTIYFQISTVFLIFTLLSELNNFTLRAILQIKTANYNNVLTLVFRVITIAALTFLMFRKDNPLILQFIAGCFIAWLLSQISVQKHFFKPAKGQEVMVKVPYTQILSVATPMLVTYLGFFLTNYADAYILPFYTTPELVGIYKTCGNVSGIAGMALIAMNTTIQPKISQLYHQGNHQEVMKLCVKFSKLIFLLNIPIFLLIIFGSKWMILFAYGKEFVPGALSLSIMAIGQIFNVACGPVAQLLNVTGNHKQFRNIAVFGAVINVILIFPLIPVYGIEGAAAASAVSMIVWNIVGTLYIKKKFGYYIAFVPFVNLNKNIVFPKSTPDA